MILNYILGAAGTLAGTFAGTLGGRRRRSVASGNNIGLPWILPYNTI